ncbi:hypothetical protein L228DRAFT_56544 [Xylona heveae TC161]|uniref:Amidoligase enzyme n=1 Tax=Xylona heveae (strain CBS 132557 / TC161) TaxID=1328760 RepID=A0A165IFA0_XYLHT|nr:hypothetical protein L228DRAFT_56544 [Xylona heveae TC161]KZF24818.1 hypothetical protein L228DRAFT_56544 [Xylona heveae TC161]
MSYKFGIEIETIIKLKPSTHIDLIDVPTTARDKDHNRAAVHRFVAERLGEESLGVITSHRESDGKHWFIIYDESVNEADENMYATEIVSPAFPLNSNWQKELSLVFQILDTYFTTVKDASCGTHVHISRADSDFSIVNTKPILKACIYFQEAIEKCLPVYRRNANWCCPNVEMSEELTELYPRESGQSFKRIFDRVDATTTMEDIVSLFSPSRHATWNLRNILYQRGTIEFRAPPQVLTARSTIHWIAFAVAFLELSTTCSFSRKEQASEPGTLLELRAGIMPALNSLGLSSAISSLLVSEDDPRMDDYDAIEILAKKRQKKEQRGLIQALASKP